MDMNLLLSGLFFTIGILVVIKNVVHNTPYPFLWFCDFSPFLFAIAFLIENTQINKAVINVGFLTQLVTLVLLSYGLISGKDIIGSKKAVSRGKFYVLVEILIHLPAIAALILTYKIAPTAESLIYSFILFAMMFVLTLMFTSSDMNINLLYNLGIPNGKKSGNLKLPFHTVLWIFYAFIVALITYLIQYFIYLYIGI